MQAEKKYLVNIRPNYKRMDKELADYMFFYTIRIWSGRYGIDNCTQLLSILCDLALCDKPQVMNAFVRMRVYPEEFKHDMRHVAFLMYAMDVPANLIAWTLHIQPVMMRSWVKAQLNSPPQIKRLFTDPITSEIIKVLSTLKNFKEVLI